MNSMKRIGFLRPQYLKQLHRFYSTASSSLPFNVGVYFVPQQEAFIIERFGKYNRTLQPGVNFAIPLVEKVAYIQSLKEIAIEIPEQPAITVDNVSLHLTGVLYLRVVDPYKASYGVEDPEFAITQLAQTTMRSEIGKITLDQCLREREFLNNKIVVCMNDASTPWGINCLRYEIRDISLPEKIRISMQSQVEAERKKRAAILESEGMRQADINVAEGKKLAQILASEAQKQSAINRAVGESAAVLAAAKARSSAITAISAAIGQKDGMHAVNMSLAEQYIAAFGKLAKQSNTLMLPANTGDVSSVVAQALSVYSSLNQGNPGSAAAAANDSKPEELTVESIRQDLEKFSDEQTKAAEIYKDISESEKDKYQ